MLEFLWWIFIIVCFVVCMAMLHTAISLIWKLSDEQPDMLFNFKDSKDEEEKEDRGGSL